MLRRLSAGLRPTIPALPHALVVEQPQEDAAHDGPRLKTCLCRVVRSVPVAHRRPTRRRVQEIEKRPDKRLEVGARSRERGCPEIVSRPIIGRRYNRRTSLPAMGFLRLALSVANHTADHPASR